MASKTILTLAGRRIDNVNADKDRFPSRSITRVKNALKQFFLDRHIAALISSAACGADLLAQQVARDLGIPREVILPFDEATFRQTSVVDRPGDWGVLYDSLLEDCSLRILGYEKSDELAYSRVNDEILSVGNQMAQDVQGKIALCLWDGVRKDNADATVEFKNKALAAGYTVFEINTLNGYEFHG